MGDVIPVPDIGNKLENDENIENNLKLQLIEDEKETPAEKNLTKITFNHVKTPDEVDDLPEHEVAADDENLLDDYENTDLDQKQDGTDVKEDIMASGDKNDWDKNEKEYESKIAKDETEKEKDKEDKRPDTNDDVEENYINEEQVCMVSEKHDEVSKKIIDVENNIDDIKETSVEEPRDDEVLVVAVDQKMFEPSDEKVFDKSNDDFESVKYKKEEDMVHQEAKNIPVDDVDASPSLDNASKNIVNES